ncbi:hypothetical protein J6590_027138 [Homalodisca vitripennis]|nr:hypothetical protein J6590_027138 [Homalodisca vitripennis]
MLGNLRVKDGVNPHHYQHSVVKLGHVTEAGHRRSQHPPLSAISSNTWTRDRFWSSVVLVRFIHVGESPDHRRRQHAPVSALSSNN